MKKKITNPNYKAALEIAAKDFYEWFIEKKPLSKYVDKKDIWIQKHINYWLKKADKMREPSQHERKGGIE